MGPSLLQLWQEHQSWCLVVVSALVMGSAWLWVLWGYRNSSGYRAPARWYTGYVPPEFLLPCKWDLREFNAQFKPEREREREPRDGHPGDTVSPISPSSAD